MSELALTDAADTERLGAALARTVPWSAAHALIVYLHGELGAGKTTLARGLLRELGVAGTVRSPSYTLLESYETAGHRVLHLDLYRVSGSAELAPLGVREELDPGVLLLIEWPERAGAALPAPDLRITLSVTAAGHTAGLEGQTAVGTAWLNACRMASTAELKRI